MYLGEKRCRRFRIIPGCVPQGLRGGPDGGDRRAQFVGDVGDEVAAHGFEASQIVHLHQDTQNTAGASGERGGVR